MICYMPFTHIEGPFLDKITKAVGPVTIYCPGAGMVSDDMLSAVRERKLDLRSEHGVRADHLAQAVQEFKDWADLHGGAIADLAGLSKSLRGRPPLMDDTNPTSIGHQVRHFGEQNVGETTDPVFQAALFLSMAQQYDQQLAAVSRDLGEVLTMEQKMLARLAGGTDGVNSGAMAASIASDSAELSDTGAFMTAKRVQSWAELVCRDEGPRSFLLYITSSPAVLDYTLNLFEHVHGPQCTSLEAANEVLNALGAAQDPAAVSMDQFQDCPSGANATNLMIYALEGISPTDFPSHLSLTGNRIGQGAHTGQGPINTIIGLIEK
jgi:hypothetical protein